MTNALWHAILVWGFNLGTPVVCVAAIQYSVTDLGTLGGEYVSVSGINNRGQVVGNSTTNGLNFMHAFVYGGGSLTDLGSLGGTNSYGYGINDQGQAVGAAYTGGGADDAFLYTGGSMTDIGTLGGTGSAARAINNNGQIAGEAWLSGNTELHAYLDSGGTKADLGTLGGSAARPSVSTIMARWLEEPPLAASAHTMPSYTVPG